MRTPTTTATLPALGSLAAAFVASLAAFVAVSLVAAPAAAQSVPEPPREFRAAWIASVHNIDWPSKRGMPASAQQAELRGLLDLAASVGLNAVVLQVRPACDALYESRKEPWSAWLTGTEGRSPGYDPLAFAVAEAHARGLELHAWFNPFRASGSASASHSADHVSRRKPAWVQRYNGLLWLDPGLAEVRQYSRDVILDVVKRYDIDGVHLDDYFYPYPKSHLVGRPPSPFFNDDASFARYGGGDRADWRRANIDAFVKELYDDIKRAKRHVKLGISPFGIWRPNNPPGIEAGLDAYAHIYADSRRWFSEGWLDYFTPQLYWLDGGPQSFSTLTRWWDAQNKSGRHLWPGVASSRIGSSGDNRPASEIVKQINLTRAHITRSAPCHVHWSISPLRQNRSGIVDLARKNAYPSQALVPPSPWLGRSAPPAPKPRREGGGTIAWDGVRGARWYSVQTRDGGTWGLAAVLPAARTGINLTSLPDAVAIRAISSSGHLSAPSVLETR
ncbi:family 10 glycosylhydrolase [soil metagenome]